MNHVRDNLNLAIRDDLTRLGRDLKAYMDDEEKPMKDYQQRVVDEEAELDERLTKLKNFLASNLFLTLPEPEQGRLRRQSYAMIEYRDILRERIAAFEP